MPEVMKTLIEMGGLGLFMWYLIKGLESQIGALKATIDAQKVTLETQEKTLGAMEKRVVEAEKIGQLYKTLLNELPADIGKYKETLRALKDDLIAELEQASKAKDQKLKDLANSKLAQIELQEQVLEELPRLRDDIFSSFKSLELKVSVLDKLQPGTALGDLFKELEEFAEHRRSTKTNLLLPFDGRTREAKAAEPRASDA